MKFKFQIKRVETYVKIIEVDATSEEEAYEKAEKWSDAHDIAQLMGTWDEEEGQDVDLIEDHEITGENIEWWFENECPDPS